MPKTARQSRWFLFSLEDSSLEFVRKQIQQAGVETAQYYMDEEGVIHGYLYFPSIRPVPRKKSWISGAKITMAIVSDIKHKLFKHYSILILFGTNPLITPPDITPVSVATKAIVAPVAKDTVTRTKVDYDKLWKIQNARLYGPDPLADQPPLPEKSVYIPQVEFEKPILQAYPITLKSGITFSESTIDTLFCIEDEDELKEVMSSKSPSELSLFHKEVEAIKANYQEVLISLIQSQRNNKEGEA